MPAQTTAPKYPEHEKLAAVCEESQAIGEFLDFGLAKQGIHLAVIDEHWSNDRLMLCPRSIEAILADYFGIDQAKIDAEKEQMLAAIREESR